MDFSFSEILLILAIALIVLGPQDLLKYSQKIGRWMGKLKTQLNNVQVMLNEEMMQEEKRKLEEAMKIEPKAVSKDEKKEDG